MIQFPETAQSEWQIIADAASADERVRQQIERDTLVDREVERLRIRHEAALAFQQELDADQTPELVMMTLQNYKNNPASAPADLIEGVMKDNGLCIMLGPSGSGKSTAGLQMLHSLMSGDDWLGQPVQQISGSVGVLSYDMDGSLVMDWMAGYPNVDPTKVSIVNAYKRGNPLGVPPMRAQIVQAWKDMNVEVIVVDSFSASFFHQDQNDAAATMAHYRDLKLFALTEVGAKALVVIVHSTDGSPHKARGSSVHHDVADSIVSLSVDPNTQDRRLHMVKYRQARGQHQMNDVIVTAPDDVTHLISVNTGGMVMQGMHLPPSAIAAAFPDLPDATEDPNTDSDENEEDDL